MEFVVVQIGQRRFTVPEGVSQSMIDLCEAAERALQATIGDALSVRMLAFNPQKKIAAIKFVRNCTGKNLRDSKALVDDLQLHGRLITLGVFLYTEALTRKAEAEECDVVIDVPTPLEMLAQQAK